MVGPDILRNIQFPQVKVRPEVAVTILFLAAPLLPINGEGLRADILNAFRNVRQGVGIYTADEIAERAVKQKIAEHAQWRKTYFRRK